VSRGSQQHNMDFSVSLRHRQSAISEWNHYSCRSSWRSK